jgi:L-rhamnonate dehydratase
VKIKDIRVVKVTFPVPKQTTKPRRPSWWEHGPVANPMTRYPRYAAFRPSWLPTFGHYGVIIEAEDGTQGFALGHTGTPAASIIHEHLAPRLIGEPALAHEKVYDMAVRMCAPFGTLGVAAYAVSAIDLAMWDLKGKLFDKPVYELLGGPAHDELFCYATGNDTDWHLELGFKASKMACPYGPADGIEGIHKNAELVQSRREMVGSEVELMLDCWLAFDVEYCVRLAQTLRPFGLKWMEETLAADDLASHKRLRERLPWQTLATGEHWYGTSTFHQAAAMGLVDILQADINWVGGMTAMVKIAAIAEAAGISLIPHAGGNTPYGQHACYALPAIPWTECFCATAPGVPLDEAASIPGMPLPKDGKLKPSNAPGFGVELGDVKIEPYFA